MELLSFGNTGWGDELFIATLMTVAVSITAMFIGFIFALIFTPLKLSKNKFFNLIGNCYTTVIRGVPELLVIYLFFFGGSGAIMYVASIFGYNDYIEINAFITGSLAIGIISGAYSTEVFRGAVQSIDKGQFEAAQVLGLSKSIQFYKIILPQVLRIAIPNLSNVWQITLKDTSLISVTGLVEIMRQSYIAAGSTRDPLFFYSFAAVIYLSLTFISMKLINKLEMKYSKGY
jgi:octopine/nopaline transport system permease protein